MTTTVVINVFIGTEAQVPTQYQVEGTIYWDLIENLIKYGLNGEVINSGDPIIFPELNYIIAGGSPIAVFVEAKARSSGDYLLGPTLSYNIFCRSNSSIAEIKRSALAQGTCASLLTYRRQILADKNTLEDYKIGSGDILKGSVSFGTGECFRYV